MAKHRVSKEGRSLFGSRKRDSLFERSFTQCNGCGDDVYVLAEDCRSCGVVLHETRLQEPVRQAQPAAQGHYAQLTRQSQPVQPQPAPQAQPARRPVRQPRAVHWAQLASQARMAAVSGEIRLRAS